LFPIADFSALRVESEYNLYGFAVDCGIEFASFKLVVKPVRDFVVLTRLHRSPRFFWFFPCKAVNSRFAGDKAGTAQTESILFIPIVFFARCVNNFDHEQGPHPVDRWLPSFAEPPVMKRIRARFRRLLLLRDLKRIFVLGFPANQSQFIAPWFSSF